MEIYLQICSLIYLCLFSPSLADFFYNPEDIFTYLDEYGLPDDEYQVILGNISKVFQNSYAFYDISKNPPNPDYHSKVDIQQRLSEINVSDSNYYQFYQKISNALADLKDSHIKITLEDNDYEDLYIVSPFDFYMGQDNEGNPRIFADCLTSEALDEFDESGDLTYFCEYSNEGPVISINGMDPFDYISKFGGNYVTTKNVHGTFSFKMRFHNTISLSDYPLTLEELNNLVVVFENGDEEEGTEIQTRYMLSSKEEIEFEPMFLRALSTGRGFYLREFYKQIKGKYVKDFNIEEEIAKKKSTKRKTNRRHNNIKDKSKIRNLETIIYWNHEAEQIFKCYYDETNKLNIYYISSFMPEDKEEYKKTIIECVKLFDQNEFPIVVINDLNNGGYVSLSQFFMGVLSPLMPIQLFKGRIRLTEGFKETDEVNSYIHSNLTDISTCGNVSFQNLTEGQVEVSYSENNLSQMFYINNDSYYKEIEEIRLNMKHKRKPTDILVLTDGYSFSAAGLFIKYIQKIGGAIVAGYYGNPKDDSVFDSAQSPSPVFTSNIIGVFNPDEFSVLNDTYNITLEMPGIQTFYYMDDKEIPLEYEVTPVDIRLKIYVEFSEENYQAFIEKINEFFKNMDNGLCFSNNKNLVKISEDCNSTFKNNYTHGGYVCGDDNKWSDKCIEAYCDIGYSFDPKQRICVKDVCSSVIVPDDEGEKEKEKEKKEEEEDKGQNLDNIYIAIICVAGIIVLIILICLIIHCCKGKTNSNSIEVESQIKKIALIEGM